MSIAPSRDLARDEQQVACAHRLGLISKCSRHAGVDVSFLEAAGQIHGCFTLRQAIPSTQADLHACLAALKLLIADAAAPALAQAAE